MCRKQLLVASVGGDVQAVDNKWLDPRRPYVPTADSQAEGLLPYNSTIPMLHKYTINYDLKLAHIHGTVRLTAGIHASPARLESTSIVFVYGLDLFHTHITPSGPFDLLSDFQYGALVITVGSIIVLTFQTSRWLRTKRLNQKWN